MHHLLYTRSPFSVAVAGATGYYVGIVNNGGTLGYLRSDSPSMSSPVFTSLAAVPGLSAACNIQEVNGILFIPVSTATDPCIVSTDGGLTWQNTNIPLSPASRTVHEPITWNGTYYHRFHWRSLDGITWAITPNSPNASIVPYSCYSRASDGYIMMHYNQAPLAGNTYYSTDNGASWILGGFIDGWSWSGYGATNGTRVWMTNDGDGAAYTDNFFVSRTGNGTGPGYHRLHKSGTWLGLRGTAIKRVTGNGTAWNTQYTLTSPPTQGQSIEWSDSTARCLEIKATSFDIVESIDDGATWSSLGNITGYTPNTVTSYVRITTAAEPDTGFMQWNTSVGEYDVVGDGLVTATTASASWAGAIGTARAQGFSSLSALLHDKLYFEFSITTLNTTPAGRFYMGVHGISQAVWPGTTNTGVILSPQRGDATADYAQLGGSSTVTGSLDWSSGSTGIARVRMAVDIPSRQVWFGVGASGAWVLGDPVAVSGGYTVGGTEPLYLYGDVSCISDPQQRTVSIVPVVGHAFAPPAGFTAAGS